MKAARKLKIFLLHKLSTGMQTSQSKILENTEYNAMRLANCMCLQYRVDTRFADSKTQRGMPRRDCRCRKNSQKRTERQQRIWIQSAAKLAGQKAAPTGDLSARLTDVTTAVQWVVRMAGMWAGLTGVLKARRLVAR